MNNKEKAFDAIHKVAVEMNSLQYREQPAVFVDDIVDGFTVYFVRLGKNDYAINIKVFEDLYSFWTMPHGINGPYFETLHAIELAWEFYQKVGAIRKHFDVTTNKEQKPIEIKNDNLNSRDFFNKIMWE